MELLRVGRGVTSGSMTHIPPLALRNLFLTKMDQNLVKSVLNTLGEIWLWNCH